jgi:hypothetical protein
MYATLDFYRNTYLGSDASDTELTKWLTRASDDIDAATQYQITSLDDYGATIQTLVQKATCAQAEWYINNGGDLSGVSNLSIGSFSIGKSDSGTPAVLCSRAMQYLSPTGLACRVIGSAECRYPVQH